MRIVFLYLIILVKVIKNIDPNMNEKLKVLFWYEKCVTVKESDTLIQIFMNM